MGKVWLRDLRTNADPLSHFLHSVNAGAENVSQFFANFSHLCWAIQIGSQQQKISLLFGCSRLYRCALHIAFAVLFLNLSYHFISMRENELSC